MSVTIHESITQGSEEWFKARCGLLTASEMKLIITPANLQYSRSEKCKSHFYELLAQRVTGYVEPHYIGDDMLRGKDDEIDAREVYAENYAPVREVGFITNNKWGFTLGYSPDGLVGCDGIIEVKGRRQKYQMQTIIHQEVPQEYMIQIQTGLLVSERKWCDFISYCGGLPMFTQRVNADEDMQKAIVEAATAFESDMAKEISRYNSLLTGGTVRLIPTERRIETEIFV